MRCSIRSFGQPTLIMPVPELEWRIVTGSVVIIFLELLVAKGFSEIMKAVEPVVVRRVTPEMTDVYSGKFIRKSFRNSVE